MFESGKTKVKQTTNNVFLVKTKSKSNPDPVPGKKTSLLILLEAAGVRFPKNPKSSPCTPLNSTHESKYALLSSFSEWKQAS